MSVTTRDSLTGVYSSEVIRQFAVMSVVWGVVGMLVGVIIAAQLAFPELNLACPGLRSGACVRCTPMP